MSVEKVTEFFKVLASDKDLQNTIDKADLEYTGSREDPKAAAEAIVLSVAKEAGYEFTAKDLWEYNAKRANREMSDDELESVAGGAPVGRAPGNGYTVDGYLMILHDSHCCPYYSGAGVADKRCENCIYYSKEHWYYAVCKNEINRTERRN